MKYAYFPGCKAQYYVDYYDQATRAVCQTLELNLAEIEFGCCGYSVRDLDFSAFVLTAARNLALAGQGNLDIITPCMCCYGNLKHADHFLKEDARLADNVNAVLSEESLEWTGDVEIRHLLQVLSGEIGLARIKERLKYRFKGLKMAVHYGCHVLRPSKVVNFDNPLGPTIFDKLVEVTGAESVNWSARLECCGNPASGKNDQLASDLMTRKVVNAREAGAGFITSACNYCQVQFDLFQSQAQGLKSSPSLLPAIAYTQVLGLSLGLSDEAVGLNKNKTDVRGIKEFLKPAGEEDEPAEKSKSKKAKEKPSEAEAEEV